MLVSLSVSIRFTVFYEMSFLWLKYMYLNLLHPTPPQRLVEPDKALGNLDHLLSVVMMRLH